MCIELFLVFHYPYKTHLWDEGEKEDHVKDLDNLENYVRPNKDAYLTTQTKPR